MKLRLWVDVAEIAASLAVVATLGLLIVQINQSNKIEQRQSALRHAQWDAQMFLLSDELPRILAKIKAVDGHDLQSWIDQYELSYADQGIRTMAQWPDQQLFVQGMFLSGSTFFDDEFSDYVRDLIEQMP